MFELEDLFCVVGRAREHPSPGDNPPRFVLRVLRRPLCDRGGGLIGVLGALVLVVEARVADQIGAVDRGQHHVPAVAARVD